MAVKTKRVKGATLIESLTALAIVTTVMGAAFTLYEKTVSTQQQVMKTKAKLLQVNAEHQLYQTGRITDLSDEAIKVDITEEPYQQQTDMKQVNITFSTRNGKLIMQKNYLRYIPAKP
jgi:Tfp pilus assembly protein PilE